MPRRKLGVPAHDLDDDDLRRELAHLYETRWETLVDGSQSALRTHTDRMLELEHEYVSRFSEQTKPSPRRTRRGSRSLAGRPTRRNNVRANAADATSGTSAPPGHD
jgi:hypothetical protein